MRISTILIITSTVLSVACSGDKTLTVTVNPPTVLIQEPTDNSNIQQNSTYTIRGYIQDNAYNNQLSDMEVFWTVNGQSVCEDSIADLGGNVTCDHTFSTAGEIPIELQVVNPGGKTGSATNIINVLSNLPPEAEILKPDNSINYYSDYMITFEGVISDNESPTSDLLGYWTSSIDGELDISPSPDGDGIIFGEEFLSPGEHIITFTAEEPSGQIGDSTITITVGNENNLPVCSIITPAPGATFGATDVVTVSGEAEDLDVVPSELTAIWRSNVDGELTSVQVNSDGTFSTGITNLSVGPHTITLNVEDEVGGRCTKSVDIVIGAGPSVEITAPTDNTVFNFGYRADFQGLVSDLQDNEQDLLIDWSSNLDGTFSTQRATSNGIAVANTFALSVGTHIVTLEATDSDGFSSTDTVSVVINDLPIAPVIALEPSPTTSSDDVNVAINQPSTDTEGDPITYSYVWQRNGIQTAHTASSVPYTDTTRGDVWSVVVTPNDGYGNGTPSNASTTIVNSAPFLVAANLSTSIVYETNSITCSQSGGYDEDGDTITYAYEWTVNGTPVSTSTTINGSLFDHGDVIICNITPSDGQSVNGTGLTVSSTPITVTNSLPVLASANLTPTNAYEASTLTCQHPNATDADPSDIPNLNYIYDWYVNGAMLNVHQNTLDGNNFDKGDAVLCSVTPNDGIDSGTSVSSNSVTIKNTAPTLGVVGLGPNPSTEASTLTCTPQVGTYSDDDGDSISFTYDWIVNGSTLGIASSTLTGSNFNKNDTVSCIATPTDGTNSGNSITSNPLTIQNTAPTVTAPTLSPNPADVSDTLQCTSGTTNDIDPADSVTVAYSWMVNGTAITATSSSLTASGNFVRGNTVTCTVTPNDGIVNGNPVNSNTLTIQNSTPSIGTVGLTPNPAFEASTLSCTDAGTVDLDGDTVTFSYQWFVNNTQQPVTNNQLTGTYYNKGDSVYCTMTPSDGTSTGTLVSSSPVTISNTAPVANAPSLSPAVSYETSTLTCTGNGGTDDDPADSLTYTMGWIVNGATIGQTGNTLNGNFFDKGDAVKCFIVPNDGTTSGAPVNSPVVVISNSLPSVNSITIAPNGPFTTTTLTSAASGWSDVDGDAEGYLYQWFNQSGAIANATNSTLSSSLTVKNDVIYVRATPFDGVGSGTPVNSNTLTVQNSTPTSPVLEIQPTIAEPGDALTCVIITPSTDADGDTITYTYQWFEGGNLVSGYTTNAIPANVTQHNDLWTCAATPSDGVAVGTPGSDSQSIADITAPNAPVLNAIDPHRNNNSVTITGSAEALSSIFVYRDCVNPNPSGSNGLFVSTTIASSTGLFSVTVSLFEGDDCEFYAVAVDTFNNASVESNSLFTEYCSPFDNYEISSNNGNSGDSCAAAIDLWNTLGTSVTGAGSAGISITGNALAAGDQDWYYIDSTQLVQSGVNYYNFTAELTAGSGSYDLAVFRGGCASSNATCTGTYDTYEYFAQDVGEGFHSIPGDTRSCTDGSSTRNNCDDLSSDYYIRVTRTDNSTDCTHYVLSVTNGY